MQKTKELITQWEGKNPLVEDNRSITKYHQNQQSLPCLCQRWECNDLIRPGIIMHLTVDS